MVDKNDKSLECAQLLESGVVQIGRLTDMLEYVGDMMHELTEAIDGLAPAEPDDDEDDDWP